MQMLKQMKAVLSPPVDINHDFILAKSHIGNLDGIARIGRTARSGKRAC